MKKLILILVIFIVLLSGFVYFFTQNRTSENQEEISSESEPSSPMPVQNLLSDEELLPYSDLPDYEYSTEKIALYNENQRIYGECLIPDAGEKVPLVICCHGLGANLYSTYDYGKIFAQKGLASFMFDFRGGGGTNSEGESTNMSVLTEVSDLEVVIENVKTWDFVDPEKIVLFGESQGGLVAALTAAKHPDDIAGLILEYPAFVIDDTIRSFEVNEEELPESFTFGNLTIGKRYVLDILGFDSYEEIKNYKKHVLILQGDEDTIVPEEYSKKASETYNSAEYYIIPGAGHGFNNEEFDESLIYIFNYLERIGIIPV